jgi:N-dimethylarginine dimethylaminohydrolase
MARVGHKRLLVCESSDFQVDYSINPWMKPGTSNPEEAVRQWHKMVEVVAATGIEIEVLEFPAGSPQELIWTRDAFAMIEGQIVLANFKYDVRNLEVPFYRAWFEQHGFHPVQAIATMEGGNMIPHAGRYYIGTGFRSTEADCRQLASQFDIEVVPLAVTDNVFFHLDLALFSLDADNAFYYPPAFSADAVKTLKSQIKNLHELSEQEMNGYCTNSIALGDEVIMQSGNPAFRRKLETLGKKVHEVDLSEFKNIGGGGIHCLTNVLEW